MADTDELTTEEFNKLSPFMQQEHRRQWLAKLDALGGNVNLMDDNDPAWLRVGLDDGAQEWDAGGTLKHFSMDRRL
jgi:hypothetical protein